MQQITMDDLKRIMRDCAGEDGQGLNGDIHDSSFDELGYDSLALLETTSRISKEFTVTLPDDVVTVLKTPGELLDFINGRISAKA
jgi:act minimal PKS acyl carrier protein